MGRGGGTRYLDFRGSTLSGEIEKDFLHGNVPITNSKQALLSNGITLILFVENSDHVPFFVLLLKSPLLDSSFEHLSAAFKSESTASGEPPEVIPSFDTMLLHDVHDFA